MRIGRTQDHDLILRLWNEVWPERPLTAGELSADAGLEEKYQTTTYVAEVDGDPVGIMRRWNDAGSYDPRKFIIEIAIREERRKQGIGRALFEHGVEDCLKHGVQEFTTVVREDDPTAIGFAERRGFREAKRDFFSRLHVESFSAEAWEKPLPDGYDVVPFARIRTDETARKHHGVFEQVRVDVPRSSPPTTLAFEFYRDHVLGDADFRADISQVLLFQGEIVGFSTVFDGEEGFAFQSLTGVLREHRGKGLATAMKVRVVMACKAAGLREIHTDNDTRNVPILRINDAFGFERSVATISMVKKFSPDAP